MHCCLSFASLDVGRSRCSLFSALRFLLSVSAVRWIRYLPRAQHTQIHLQSAASPIINTVERSRSDVKVVELIMDHGARRGRVLHEIL